MIKFLRSLNAIQSQFICHTLYVILSFRIFVEERPVGLYLAMIGFTLILDFALARLLKAKSQRLVSLASIGICNSIFLNMEAYGTIYWPYFLALSASLIAKYVLRNKDRPIYNPSLVGVFLVVTALPQWGAPAMYFWNNQTVYLLLVFALGNWVTARAGTMRICYGYLMSFIVTALVVSYFAKIGVPGMRTLIPEGMPVLLLPLSVFCFGNILFAFHGIGDPSTGPLDPGAQWKFGAAIGALDLFLRLGMVIVAPFVAYVIVLLVVATARSLQPVGLSAVKSRGPVPAPKFSSP